MVLKEKKAIRQAASPEEPRREWGPFKTGSAGNKTKDLRLLRGQIQDCANAVVSRCFELHGFS